LLEIVIAADAVLGQDQGQKSVTDQGQEAEIVVAVEILIAGDLLDVVLAEKDIGIVAESGITVEAEIEVGKEEIIIGAGGVTAEIEVVGIGSERETGTGVEIERGVGTEVERGTETGVGIAVEIGVRKKRVEAKTKMAGEALNTKIEVVEIKKVEKRKIVKMKRTNRKQKMKMRKKTGVTAKQKKNGRRLLDKTMERRDTGRLSRQN